MKHYGAESAAVLIASLASFLVTCSFGSAVTADRKAAHPRRLIHVAQELPISCCHLLKSPDPSTSGLPENRKKRWDRVLSSSHKMTMFWRALNLQTTCACTSRKGLVQPSAHSLRFCCRTAASCMLHLTSASCLQSHHSLELLKCLVRTFCARRSDPQVVSATRFSTPVQGSSACCRRPREGSRQKAQPDVLAGCLVEGVLYLDGLFVSILAWAAGKLHCCLSDGNGNDASSSAPP